MKAKSPNPVKFTGSSTDKSHSTGDRATDATLLSVYGLKWNPFTASVPVEGMFCPPQVNAFIRRCETYMADGGFAMITSPPGTGKSSTLRLLDDRLSRVRDVVVRAISHPQSHVTNFYRELGDLFGMTVSVHNLYGGFKAVREKWQTHINTALIRPMLIIDEAQEMTPPTLNELRLLSSTDYDSRALLFVVLAGDHRLVDKLETKDLAPLKSRIRTHLSLQSVNPAELAEALRHVIDAAGNSQLMSSALITTLAEHAAGNYRTMMCMANELLVVARERDLPQIDEKLFFDVFSLSPEASNPRGKRR